MIDVIRYGGDFLPKGITRKVSIDFDNSSDEKNAVIFNEFSITDPSS